jgi:hypothetical protein
MTPESADEQKSRRWPAIVGATLVAVLFVWFWVRPTIEECVSERRAAGAYKAGPEDPSLPGDLGFCTGKAFAENTETLLAGATILLVIVTYRLWRSTWQLAADSKNSSQRQLRAYLGIVRCEYHSQTGDRALIYDIKIRNFGKTPAYGVSATTTRKILPYPLAADYRLVEDKDADLEAGASPSYLTIQPGETRMITSSGRDGRFSDADINAFQDSRDTDPEQVQLYCYGTLTYSDAFGRSHWARYCRLFGGDSYKRTGKPILSHLYNDSSDDPKEKPKGPPPERQNTVRYLARGN